MRIESYPLPRASSKLGASWRSLRTASSTISPTTFRATASAGLLIIKDGKVLREHHDLGMDQRDALAVDVGGAIDQHHIESAPRSATAIPATVDGLLTHYLPEFARLYHTRRSPFVICCRWRPA